MEQLTLNDFIPLDNELLLCSLSKGYHWIRISSGGTPSTFLNRVQFEIDGYDYFYENTDGKDEIVMEFNGEIHEIGWEQNKEVN